MRYLTEDLVSAIERRCFAPNSQSAFTPADFITLLNEKMEIEVTSELMKLRSNYFLTSIRISVTAAQQLYPRPERAIGGTIKQLFWIDGVGNRTELIFRDIDVLEGYATSPSAGTPGWWFFQGENICLYPAPSSSGTLECWFYAKLNQLVPTASCAKITDVSSAGGTTTFTVDTDLTASLSVGSTLDFLRGRAPFSLNAIDVAITAITASTIAVATTDVQNAASAVTPVANDYICPARQANIPMLPEEFHPMLAQMVVVLIMQPLGDSKKRQDSIDELERMKASAFNLVAHRVESQPEMLVDRSGFAAYIGDGWPGSPFSVR